MRSIFLSAVFFILVLFLFGCSSSYQKDDSDETNEINKTSNSEELGETNKSNEVTNKNSEPNTQKENTEEKIEKNNKDNTTSTEEKDSVSKEKMKAFKNKMRTFIFDEYMGGPNYVYAKGVNWTENFYDNLNAAEIWNLMQRYKKKQSGEEGTMMQKAKYLSRNAPIKDNWKELFLENWKNSPYAENNKIEKMIDKGDKVWIYTKKMPYTGKENNYPYIILDKRTGFWHG